MIAGFDPSASPDERSAALPSGKLWVWRWIRWAFPQVKNIISWAAPYARYTHIPLDGIPGALLLGRVPTHALIDDLLQQYNLGLVIALVEPDEAIVEPEHYDSVDVTLLQIDTPDTEAPNSNAMRAAADAAAATLWSGRSVYVHCTWGRGRSCAMAAVVAARVTGVSVDVAMDTIRDARPAVNASEPQIAAARGAVR